MRSNVTNYYRSIFGEIESFEGALDVYNNFQLFVLHYMFIPAINESLEQYRLMWNSHQVRTEHYRSPDQILIEDAHLFPPELVLDPTDYPDDEAEDLSMEEAFPFVPFIPARNPFDDEEFAMR